MVWALSFQYPQEAGNKDNFCNLPKAEREKLITMLEEAELSPGPLFRAALVATRAREEDDGAKFVSLVLPYSCRVDGEEADKFMLREAALCDTGLSDLDMASEFLDASVTRRMIPLLKAGKAKVDDLCSLCRAFETALAPDRVPRQLGTICSRAVGDVRRIAIYLLAVAGKTTCEDTATAVQEVRSAKTGSLALVKMAVAQTAHWKDMEVQFRATEQSMLTLGPSVDEWTKKLSDEGFSLCSDTFKEVVRKMPVWMDNLRAHRLEAFVAALRSAVQKWRRRIEAKINLVDDISDRTQANVVAFTEACKYAADMLQQDKELKVFFQTNADELSGQHAKAMDAQLQRDVEHAVEFLVEIEDCINGISLRAQGTVSWPAMF